MLFVFGFFLLNTRLVYSQSSNDKKIVKDDLYLIDYSNEHRLKSDFTFSDYYSVAIWLNYPTYDEDYLVNKKEYYTNVNSFYLSIIGGLDEYDYYSSSSLPLITYSIKVLDNEAKKTINQLARFPFVDCIEINSMYNNFGLGDDFQINTTPPQFELPPDGGGSGPTTYTGAGIKVGIMELGYPDKSYLDNYFNKNINLQIRNKAEFSLSSHTTSIARLILEGAIDVSLFSAPIGGLGNFSIGFEPPPVGGGGDSNQFENIVAGIDWLIDNNVDVINLSMGSTTFSPTVDSISKIFNHVVYNEKITVIAASGNSSLEYVAQPSLAPNVVSIGSLSEDNSLSSYHSYRDPFANLPKPNLIDYDFINIYGKFETGTSCAAPRVTSVVARLMQRNSTLKSNPQLVMSLLQASAKQDFTTKHNLSFKENGFEDRYGAGRVVYEAALSALKLGYYSSFTITASNSNNSILVNKAINLTKNNPIHISLTALVPSYTEAETWDTTVISKIKIVVKDGNSNVVKQITTNYSTMYVKYTPSSSGNYTFQVILLDNKVSDVNIKYSYAYYR